MNPFTLAKEADKLMGFMINRYGALRVTRHYDRIKAAILTDQAMHQLKTMEQWGMLI